MTEDKLWIDFETYSEVDISTRGSMNYTKHKSTNIVCLGYAFNDEPPSIFLPHRTDLEARVIDHVRQGGKVYAHNMTFDFRIWNKPGVEFFGWPALSLDQCVDTMALCLTFQLPAKLAEAGKALNLPIQKNPEGTKLIKKCCCPMPNGKQPSPLGAFRAYFERLYAYCKQDVGAMRSIVDALPRDYLIPFEHYIWKLTYEINTRGVPIDYKAIKAIKRYIEKYVAEATSAVPILTRGAVEKVTQVQRIKDWAATQGYVMGSLNAYNVEKGLKDPNCPDNVKTMLLLRQELGRSSTAKYKKLMDLACKGPLGCWYVYDNMQYHGAGTGRWAGRGFQIHNLPRASVPNPEDEIKLFLENGEVENPVYKAKALIRPMIKAPEGWVLMPSDYSSIENRVLHWLAGDEETLADFAAGVDQYCTMAAARYGLTYDEIKSGHKAKVKKYSEMRQMGKVIILGCGFGMGSDKFVDTADLQFGMVIPLKEGVLAVKAYRARYPLVVKLWKDLKNACLKAVLSGQKVTCGRITFATAKVKGRTWLAMRLPSGKCIYYPEPGVSMRYIPGYEEMGKVATVTHMGVHPKTKQWVRLALIPGRITENAVQGTARECMAYGLKNIKERMPYVRLLPSVHDESISLWKNQDLHPLALEEYNHNLCDIPWADGLPLKAEGWIGNRYRKE